MRHFIVLLGLWLGLAQAANVTDACTLLTQTEAEAVLGKGSKVIRDSTEYQSFCAYRLPKPAAGGLEVIQIDLFVGPLKWNNQTLDGKAMFAMGLDLLKQTQGRDRDGGVSDVTSTPLSGLGDEALIFRHTLSIKKPIVATAYNIGILIRKGNQVLAVQMGGLQPPKLENLQPLARKALSRLP
ncbi:MAG: hypothetical protein ACOYW9_03020 [Deinococcota bacterium]|nr:hypothetical protein [Allomeiothermus silvanus]